MQNTISGLYPELRKFTEQVITEELKIVNERSDRIIAITQSGVDEFHKMSMFYLLQVRQDIMLMCTHAGRRIPCETDIELIARFR